MSKEGMFFSYPKLPIGGVALDQTGRLPPPPRNAKSHLCNSRRSEDILEEEGVGEVQGLGCTYTYCSKLQRHL